MVTLVEANRAMSKKTTKNDEAVEQSGAVGKMKSVLDENVNLRTALIGSQGHDRPLAEVLFDLLEGRLQVRIVLQRRRFVFAGRDGRVGRFFALDCLLGHVCVHQGSSNHSAAGPRPMRCCRTGQNRGECVTNRLHS